MANLEERVAYLENVISQMTKSSQFTIQRDMQFFDGRNIIVATGTGTKIGTAAGQKIGFYGATPVVQQSLSTIGSGSTASDGVARAAINSIINALKAVGISA